MSIRIMKHMWDYRLPDSIPTRQKSTAKLVLLKLGDNANDEGYCWPCIDRIAHECDMSYRSVSRVLSELESAMIIKRVPRYENGERISNGYWINVSKIQVESTPYEKVSKIKSSNPFDTPDRLDVRQHETVSPSDSDSKSYKPSVNHHKTTNTETDIFPKKNAYFINELSNDDYPNCHEALRVIGDLRKSGFVAYDGKLTIEEWSDCELAMSSAYEFDHVGYFPWWLSKHGDSFHKKPSLPNMLCDVNGITFEQFYDSTYLQECD